MESINKKFPNLWEILKKKIDYYWTRNVDKKVVDKKFFNLISNEKKELTLYKWSIKNEDIKLDKNKTKNPKNKSFLIKGISWQKIICDYIKCNEENWLIQILKKN